jgi:hypothetical protein
MAEFLLAKGYEQSNSFTAAVSLMTRGQYCCLAVRKKESSRKVLRQMQS